MQFGIEGENLSIQFENYALLKTIGRVAWKLDLVTRWCHERSDNLNGQINLRHNFIIIFIPIINANVIEEDRSLGKAISWADSEHIEMYLKAMWHILENGEEIKVVSIAKILDIKMLS